MFLFGLLCTIASLPLVAQKYKTAADTIKLNKEYVEVANEVAELTAKLTVAQNIIQNLIKLYRMHRKLLRKAATRHTRLPMVTWMMQKAQKRKQRKH